MVLACFLLYCFFMQSQSRGRGAFLKVEEGGGLQRLKMTNAWSFLQFCTRVLRTEVGAEAPQHPGSTAPSKGVISLNCEHISMKQVIFCFVLVRVGTWVRVLPKVRY